MFNRFTGFGKVLSPKSAKDDPAKYFPSRYGNRPKVSAVPLLLYGHHAEATAKVISESSTISCMAVEGLSNLTKVLDGRPILGFLAMSPDQSPGEAGKAIAQFRARYPKVITLYHPWSYNVERAAQRAIEYGAHGICMPGIDISEMLGYIIYIGQRADSGRPAPTTVEEHTLLLKQFTATSPFWKLQDAPDRPNY